MSFQFVAEKSMFKYKLAIMLLLSQLVTACIPIAIGTATVTAIDVALDRRTVGRNLDDGALELKLKKDFLLDPMLGNDVNITVTSVNGVVLLTGEVLNEQQRQRASILARNHPETRNVVNELALSGKTSLTSRANDSWITGRVKANLIGNRNIPATSINVTTERGKVYLLGLVTRSEADAAVQEARRVPGVTHIVKVFEYVK
ncbi:MAG: BON domain-containing protein [Pseudomonadota bacterium]